MMKELMNRIPALKSLARLLGFPGGQADSRLFVLEMLPGDCVCAEIGVHLGDFSAEILRIAHPAELHLIDPWKHEEGDTYSEALYGGKAGGQAEMDRRYGRVCARFANEIRRGCVHVHRGTSADVLSAFPDGYFDWVYIDGNHLYEFVKQDLCLSYIKTKAGGYIAGDDYGVQGWWEGGVIKAVDEFVANHPVRLITAQKEQYVLKKV
jgi:hypothetical protein